VVQLVHFRDRDRQGPDARPLDGKELTGAGVQVTLGGRVDLVAPGTRLGVEVREGVETPAGQEVVVDVVEGPFDARGPIGVADLVGDEFEAEALSEGHHLGHRHHLPSAAREHDQMRVVDHALLAASLEVRDRVGQEDLALEATEVRISLEEEHMRIAKYQRRRLHAGAPRGDLRMVRRGIVLHLLARREVVSARRLRGLVTNAVAAAEGRERRIAQGRAETRQLLVDAYEVAFARGVQRQDVVAIGLAQLGALERWHLVGTRRQHTLDRATGDPERLRNCARAVSLATKPQNGQSSRLVQHRVSTPRDSAA
jgi:hypothetical protein